MLMANEEFLSRLQDAAKDENTESKDEENLKNPSMICYRD